MTEFMIAVVLFAVLWFIIDQLLQRSRQKAEVGLSPEQIRRKRALEDQVDRISGLF